MKWLRNLLHRCEHDPGPAIHIEMGMRKVRWCKNCGKFLGERLTNKEIRDGNK